MLSSRAPPAARAPRAVRQPVPFNMTLQAEAIGGYIADAKARPNGTQVDYAALEAAHAKFAAAARKVMGEQQSLVNAMRASGASEDIERAVAELDERVALTVSATPSSAVARPNPHTRPILTLTLTLA